jgi:hypothetical protein
MDYYQMINYHLNYHVATKRVLGFIFHDFSPASIVEVFKDNG